MWQVIRSLATKTKNNNKTQKEIDIMNKLRKTFLELLSIHGHSGKETAVRSYLKPILEDKMDKVHIDTYGNLLGVKVYGNGEGATVMLNAHMDTVKAVREDVQIYEDDGIVTSSKDSALGADDRAGIAIILSVLDELTDFNGVVKVSFTREEEVGCVGSSHMKESFYKDVDLSITVDRRGSNDIVTGCFQPFCSTSVGEFLEFVSASIGETFKCVEGGISDAVTFSDSGINSVNLSAGYMNEHTKNEYACLHDMKRTANLILQTFVLINDHYKDFKPVPQFANKWVGGASSYYKAGKKVAVGYNTYSDEDKQIVQDYYEDSFNSIGLEYDDADADFDSTLSGSIWAEYDDGETFTMVYDIGDDCIVGVDSGDDYQEIKLSKKAFRAILNQLK